MAPMTAAIAIRVPITAAATTPPPPPEFPFAAFGALMFFGIGAAVVGPMGVPSVARVVIGGAARVGAARVTTARVGGTARVTGGRVRGVRGVVVLGVVVGAVVVVAIVYGVPVLIVVAPTSSQIQQS